jgi:hypothetical protein
LDPHRLELPLLGDVAGQITLAGDEARAAVLADAFYEIDLGLLPALDDAVVDVGVGLDNEPARLFGHVVHLGRGKNDDGTTFGRAAQGQWYRGERRLRTADSARLATDEGTCDNSHVQLLLSIAGRASM